MAAGAIVARLFHKEGPLHSISKYSAVAALIFHLAALYLSITPEPGQNLSITNVASIVAWIITFSMTLASFAKLHIFLMPVVYGFTALMMLVNITLPDTFIVHIELQPGLLVHIVLALFAYGCLSMALLYAIQVSYIDYKLKHKQASLLHSSLPPLMGVEDLLFKLLFIGTLLLTLSLGSGFLFLEDMFEQKQAHKTILSIIAWFVYVFILIAHKRYGWRGKGVIISTVTGSILLTLAYFGSRIVREVILGRG